MSEINFDAELTDLDNKPIVVDEKSMTLGRVAAFALSAQYREENPSIDEKIRSGSLAVRVYGGGVITLKAEDIALIKKYLAKYCAPLLFVRALKHLDPASLASASEHKD